MPACSVPPCIIRIMCGGLTSCGVSDETGHKNIKIVEMLASYQGQMRVRRKWLFQISAVGVAQETLHLAAGSTVAQSYLHL